MADNNKQDEKNQLERLKAQFSKNAGGGNKPNPPKKSGGFNFMWVYGAIFVLFIGMSIFNSMSYTATQTSYTELTRFLENDDVDKIKIISLLLQSADCCLVGM